MLNDFLFSVDGKTAQIDHIVIKPSGIFVIETKNYSDRIYGNESQHEWTQVLNYGNVKNKFYNPVKQNATHVYRLKKIIEDDIPIVPIVVFVQNNTEYIDSTHVIPLRNLSWVLNIYSGLNLETAKMEEIFHKLIDAQQNTDIEEHIANIAEMQYNIETGICPRCRGKLVLRKGRYGDFVGCENYPDCKFTKKIDQ